MRKDYMAAGDADTADAGDQAGFWSDHWTGHWARVDWRPASHRRLRLREEYRALRKYLWPLEGARVLDGGFGLGEWATLLTARGFRVTGLDISAEAVERLHRSHPEIEAAIGDVRDTGFADGSFDAYYSWGVFEHFEHETGRCIAEAWRLLRPGGFLLISVPHDNLGLAFRAAIERPAPLAPDATPRRFYQWRFTRPELADLLSREGFKVLEVRRIGARQGVLRFLSRTFGLPWQWRFSRLLALALSFIAPNAIFAHMILAVAQKPEA